MLELEDLLAAFPTAPPCGCCGSPASVVGRVSLGWVDTDTQQHVFDCPICPSHHPISAVVALWDEAAWARVVIPADEWAAARTVAFRSLAGLSPGESAAANEWSRWHLDWVAGLASMPRPPCAPPSAVPCGRAASGHPRAGHDPSGFDVRGTFAWQQVAAEVITRGWADGSRVLAGVDVPGDSRAVTRVQLLASLGFDPLVLSIQGVAPDLLLDFDPVARSWIVPPRPIPAAAQALGLLTAWRDGRSDEVADVLAAVAPDLLDRAQGIDGLGRVGVLLMWLRATDEPDLVVRRDRYRELQGVIRRKLDHRRSRPFVIVDPRDEDFDLANSLPVDAWSHWQVAPSRNEPMLSLLS